MNIFRKLFFRTLYNLGYGNYLHRQNKKQLKVPVLVFHKIIPEHDDVWPGITPKLFEEILILLKKHYIIAPLGDLCNKTALELKNTCFITFDDGYKNFLDYAYPILKNQQIHTTLFVLPNDITNDGHIWTSTIIFFVKHYSFNDISLFFQQHQLSIKYSDPENAFKLNLDITKYLSTLPQKKRGPIILELQKKFKDENRLIDKELLSFEELLLLDKKFVSINSHSLTHPSFSLEDDKKFIEHELKESKHVIERELDVQVNAFAFPFANYNSISHNLAKKYYPICFTRINDFVDLKSKEHNPHYCHDLARFNIYQSTAEEVFFVINGFHNKIKKTFFCK